MFFIIASSCLAEEDIYDFYVKPRTLGIWT
jgi:hypothetical protein